VDASGPQDADSAAPRVTARLGPAVLIVTLLGCAPHPRAAPPSPAPSDPARGASNAIPCVVADSSAPTRDTLYVIGVELRGTDAGSTDCERRVASTARSPVIVTETPGPGSDLRDVLDRGLPHTSAPRPDVVITRDPEVLSYAASGADYIIATLPWNRTYVLAAADAATTIPSDAERAALARDAVTADARGAVQPFAWLTDSNCVAPAALSSTTPRSIVAYAAGDAIARQLAERIVALASGGARPAWLPAQLAQGAQAPRVAPVVTDSIAGALATGRAAAAVVAIPRDPRAQCGTPSAPLPWRAIPLLDSRAHVIVRRGSGAAFTIGLDGSLRFLRPGAP
jgi:hypothetical protein